MQPPSQINSKADPDALDRKLCQRARLSRDPRFDGEFFVAVATTGIYCRPICPARAPAEKNVEYYRHAIQAGQAGYRPCLRCRPESAPASPAWAGTSTTVKRALALISEGALNDKPLAELAHRLGVGERYLRKLFNKELGVSPHAVAHHQRLLFARKLVLETLLPLSEIAYAAGFGSVRRFNSAMREEFRMAPGDLRRAKATKKQARSVTLLLQYRPPYDWEGITDVFARHAIEGIETVSSTHYRKHIRYEGAVTEIAVSHAPAKNALKLEVGLTDPTALMPIVANVRRMFDLDANPAAIANVLCTDKALKQLIKATPGIRSPSHWSLFESTIRAIVGQQVSTAAARSVLARMASTAKTHHEQATFPTAEELASLPDTAFPMPTRRRETLRSICKHYSGKEETLDIETLASFKGIGPWTTALVAMRGAGASDLFPHKDLGLEKAWAQLTDDKSPNLTEHAAAWRPWGAYAANLLWRSLSA
ncbi:MAG: DNA-3-methyladenine glycosylase 2 family protein [Halioglobus sp.]